MKLAQPKVKFAGHMVGITGIEVDPITHFQCQPCHVKFSTQNQLAKHFEKYHKITTCSKRIDTVG